MDSLPALELIGSAAVLLVVVIRFVFVGAFGGEGGDGGDAERKDVSMVNDEGRRLKVSAGSLSCGCFACCCLEWPRGFILSNLPLCGPLTKVLSTRAASEGY